MRHDGAVSSPTWPKLLAAAALVIVLGLGALAVDAWFRGGTYITLAPPDGATARTRGPDDPAVLDVVARLQRAVKHPGTTRDYAVPASTTWTAIEQRYRDTLGTAWTVDRSTCGPSDPGTYTCLWRERQPMYPRRMAIALLRPPAISAGAVLIVESGKGR
jgi:hypothetical protein